MKPPEFNVRVVSCFLLARIYLPNPPAPLPALKFSRENRRLCGKEGLGVGAIRGRLQDHETTRTLNSGGFMVGMMERKVCASASLHRCVSFLRNSKTSVSFPYRYVV